ncbi:uncharacterized protein LOC126851845 [Cataglyphis hispanica]|uniref:uncharacterized protein LOC126851845 n=1 Tax=Cataglyphis hispanica TaxID=1086592 RepID=UPI00217FE351|nr:uncharacterized protein LOC126851845 [Cataglyphis hispanica]
MKSWSISPAQPAGAAGLADCYLPHHGVMRKGSSAKIRIVFNGSSTVLSGASLNRHLKVDPNLLPALEDVLLRWRAHRFVLASDIEKMYRQILVAPEDRHLQRILWCYEDQTAPQTFELNTVTYGMTCAPFLAENHATLGLHWHPSGDCFSFSTRFIKVSTYTKRSVLSLTARLFDPLGWLAPTVIRAKIQFQSTRLQGLDWDTPLDEANAQQWSRFQADLPRLEEIRVQRRVPISEADARVELHGFADASERAYVAVVYARTEIRQGEIKVALVSAKTRVAPLRTMSLPRLELCAASLLARLVAHLHQALGTGDAPIHLWSDSTVALGWIRGHPSRWKVYVANRVAEIQTLSGAHWHHLPGTENPADCASRGISPSELVSHSLWWRGPPWLSEDPTSWPSSREEEPIGDQPEERVRAHAAAAPFPEVAEPEELTRFSSLNRLLQVTAWCRRWRRVLAAKHPPPVATSLPSAKDTLSASKCSRGMDSGGTGCSIQGVKNARAGSVIAEQNSLIKLTPFADPLGILRVDGRIKHALLAYDERHPMILPSSSHFTQLIVEACHRRTTCTEASGPSGSGTGSFEDGSW